jgi:hypothetical protein
LDEADGQAEPPLRLDDDAYDGDLVKAGRKHGQPIRTSLRPAGNTGTATVYVRVEKHGRVPRENHFVYGDPRPR